MRAEPAELAAAKLARLTAWTEFAQETDEESGRVFRYEIGYTQHPDHLTYWCFGIRTSWKNPENSESHEEIKYFNSCSRELRLQSVEKIPDLIEKLSKEVSRKAARIKPIVDQAREFAEALDSLLVEEDAQEEA